ncbi:hypothetical protein J0A67_01400 [Algoriphagus aestuariicola]|uniref:DUF3887 domain-containing protein n=1 Tax=Algoriphagus aestuariicola TaxID=1852016 RepID=A0ABS3BKH3_9BACT|nr:hypothetical protein [Algoriphagus aestuariicola]MBN7799492.1 hypothetical protein [Algoriphagus aestuariicola]
MKIAFGKLICACLIIASIGCQTKSYEELAENDSKAFFSNLDSFEKLSAHLVSLPTNLPEEIVEQNKAKFIKNLQEYFKGQCDDSKDFKLLKTYRKLGDNDQKNLFLKYEFCSSGTVIMGYEVVDKDVILTSVWPMKTGEQPAELFSDEADW